VACVLQLEVGTILVQVSYMNDLCTFLGHYQRGTILSYWLDFGWTCTGLADVVRRDALLQHSPSPGT
jgi:hypothetical protein